MNKKYSDAISAMIEHEDLVEHLGKFTEIITHLIESNEKVNEKLREIRKIFLIAQAAGRHPNEIKASAYRPPIHRAWCKWSDEAKKRLPFTRRYGKTSCHDRISGVVNEVILRDGGRIELTEPLFLDGWKRVR